MWIITWIVRPLVEALTFFVPLGFLLSYLEVVIEGIGREIKVKDKAGEKRKRGGWAYDLPTPYRVTGWFAVVFGLFNGKRPATLYHAFLFPLLLLLPHVTFVVQWNWSGYDECRLMADWFAALAVWDFDWFVLNPGFTWRGVRLAEWHNNKNNRLVFGLFPIDYFLELGISIVFALLAAWIKSTQIMQGSSPTELFTQAIGTYGLYTMWLVGCVFGLVLVAPHLHRWFINFNDPKKDQRHLAFPQE